MVSGLFVVIACFYVPIYVLYALFKFELFVRVVLDTDFFLLIYILLSLIQSFVIFNV